MTNIIESLKRVLVYDKDLEELAEYELYPMNGDVKVQALKKYRKYRDDLTDEKFNEVVSIIRVY